MANIRKENMYVQCSRCLNNYQSINNSRDQGTDICSSIIRKDNKVLIEYGMVALILILIHTYS